MKQNQVPRAHNFTSFRKKEKMKTLQLLVTLHLICLCCSHEDETATACFHLTEKGIESHFSQQSCLSYQENGLVGVRAVVGRDKVIRYDAFVKIDDRAFNSDRTTNSVQAGILFIPERQNDSRKRVHIGFDLNGNTLIRSSAGDDVADDNRKTSIFNLTTKSITRQKMYVVVKSKSNLVYSHHQIDLLKQKVSVLLWHNDSSSSQAISNMTEYVLLFGKMDRFTARKPSNFSDKFIVAAILFMIIASLLMTIATIAVTIRSINSEKGKRDGSKSRNIT